MKKLTKAEKIIGTILCIPFISFGVATIVTYKASEAIFEFIFDNKRQLTIALGLAILSTSSYASWVNLQKCGVENVGTGVFSHREICEGDTGSVCVPYPGGFCEGFEVIEEEVNDKPIYGEKLNVTACVDEAACEEFRFTLCQEIPEAFFFYATNSNNGFESYCTKIIGYTKVKTGNKLLQVNQKKLDAHLARLQAIKDAEISAKANKEAKCNAFKNADLSNITTVAALKAIIKLQQDCVKAEW